MTASRFVPPGRPASVLLVEDDAEISRMLIDVLHASGFRAAAAASAIEMDRSFAADEIDLVVLDVMLPGEDGLSICKRLRGASGIPIIMLTALKEDMDRIAGFEIGADDYVTKPFNPQELVARIRALLRRSYADRHGPARAARALGFAGWRIDCVARQLADPTGVKVSLTSAEFDLLLAFCRNPGRVLSRERLLELTYGGLAGPIERSVDVHVSRLRRKIEQSAGDPALIKTVRLGGYVFTPSVEAL
nr:response regulator transcription factor [Phreatobacter stygius]